MKRIECSHAESQSEGPSANGRRRSEGSKSGQDGKVIVRCSKRKKLVQAGD